MFFIKPKLIIGLSLILLSGLSLVCYASEDIYPLASPQQAALFKQTTQELRCLVCQNENLADSNAPLAKDLRAQIYQLVQQGATKQQIITYVVARYGDFVLFKPRLTPLTYLIWFGPFVLLLLSLLGLIKWIYHYSRRDSRLTLTPEEQAKLQTLLQNKE